MSRTAGGEPESLAIAVLTVSDTRGEAEDSSGDFLAQALRGAGHRLADRRMVRDDIHQIRALVAAWIASPEVDAVLITGGTGMSGRDSTPEAVIPLFDKRIEGYGEMFRALSYQEIGAATMQSRAVAGLANRTAVFCIPGSTGACKTAWNGLIGEQLDSRTQPCNFAAALRHGKANA